MTRVPIHSVLLVVALFSGIPSASAQAVRNSVAVESLRAGDWVQGSTNVASFKGYVIRCGPNTLCVRRGRDEWSVPANELRDLSRLKSRAGRGMLIGAIVGAVGTGSAVVSFDHAMCGGDASCPKDGSLGVKAGFVGGLVGGLIGTIIGGALSSWEPLVP